MSYIRFDGSFARVTNPVPLIGYDKASEVARRASRTGKMIKETVLDQKIENKGKP